MANTIATPTWVVKEVARGFINGLRFLANVNRSYDDQYRQNGAKVGRTVLARLPQRFTVADGEALQIQPLNDQTVPITLTNQKHVAFGYSSAQKTTDLDNIRQRYVNPAAESLANAADVFAFAAVYKDVYQAVGTPGTTPSAANTFLDAGVKLTDAGAPMGGRVAMLDPLAMARTASASTALFNPSATVAENYEEGMFGRKQLGIEKWFQEVNRPMHTTGGWTGTASPAVNGASQTGSTISTNGWASGSTALKKGDIITIAGVFAVNPLSYVNTGRLQQFVLTADATDSSGAIAALPISPSIITSGAYQTVTNSPANAAAITVLGASGAVTATMVATASPQSFVYHPDAFAFVMADLAKPNGGAESEFVRSKALGISIRWVEQYQIQTDQNPSRLDILIGAATIQARLATRVMG